MIRVCCDSQNTMTKALLAIGTICALATVDAFVATGPRLTTPAASFCARTSSSSIMNLPSQTGVRMQQQEQKHQVSPKFGRAARTLLFSTPAASGEDSAPAPVVAAEKGGKAAPSAIKVTAYFGLWYLFNIG